MAPAPPIATTMHPVRFLAETGNLRSPGTGHFGRIRKRSRAPTPEINPNAEGWHLLGQRQDHRRPRALAHGRRLPHRHPPGFQPVPRRRMAHCGNGIEKGRVFGLVAGRGCVSFKSRNSDPFPSPFPSNRGSYSARSRGHSSARSHHCGEEAGADHRAHSPLAKRD
jgi:hypothetical protein